MSVWLLHDSINLSLERYTCQDVDEKKKAGLFCNCTQIRHINELKLRQITKSRVLLQLDMGPFGSLFCAAHANVIESRSAARYQMFPSLLPKSGGFEMDLAEKNWVGGGGNKKLVETWTPSEQDTAYQCYISASLLRPEIAANQGSTSCSVHSSTVLSLMLMGQIRFLRHVAHMWC